MKGQESFRIKSFVKSNVWGVFEAGQSTFKKGQPIDCYNPLGSNKNIFLSGLVNIILACGLTIAVDFIYSNTEGRASLYLPFIANSTLSAPSARWDTILFGERQSRVIISISPENEKELLATANTLGVPLSEIGTTGGDFITLGNNLSVSLQELTDSWSNALEQL